MTNKATEGSDDTDITYRIGELAEEFDVSLRTLRFYEDKALLSPKRVGNKRFYSRSDRARLQLILLAKRLGFALVDIKEFLELYSSDGSNLRQLQFALAKGQEQMETLQAEETRIKQAIVELSDTLEIVRQLIADSADKQMQ